MDNILRKTIRDEIAAALSGQSSIAGQSSVSGQLSSSKGMKREQRLGSLLSKIRGRKENKATKKTKRLQLKYERFSDELQRSVVVKSRDGGGVRFLDVCTEEPVYFKDIEENAKALFFDKDGTKNGFGEEKFDCLTEISTITGEAMDENEDLWCFLKRKGLCLSKCIFFLRSTYVPMEPYVQEEVESFLNSGIKRSICQVCSCTFDGETCLICEQNDAYAESLMNDSSGGLSNVGDVSTSYFEPPTAAFQPSNVDIPENLNSPLLEDEEISHSEIQRPSPQELRQIRINNIVPSDSPRELVLKLKRNNIRADLIDQFKIHEVSRIFNNLIVFIVEELCLLFYSVKNLLTHSYFN